PHGGNDERVRAQRLQMVHGGADDPVDVDDPAASHGQRHRLAGLHRQREAAESRSHRVGHALHGRPAEGLLHASHPGEGRGAGDAGELHRGRDLNSISTKTTSRLPGFHTSCSAPPSRKYDWPGTMSFETSAWADLMRRGPVVIGTTT